MTTFILALLLAVNLLYGVSSRLYHCIKLAAMQGILLGILPLLALRLNAHGAELIVMGTVNIAIKGIALPLLLNLSLRRANIRREIEPLIGYSASVLILVLATVCAFYFSSRIELPGKVLSPLALPTAFATVFTGLFLIVTRRKALTQAIGFLVFENGIYLFGVGMMIRHGFIVELGILLDVFVLIFVMGIAVFHIRREFQHIDSDKLNHLGDFSPETAGTAASAEETQEE